LIAGFGTQIVVILVPVIWLLRTRGLLEPGQMVRSMQRQRLSLLAAGASFFLLQVATMVGWGADALLLAGIAGASDVAAFGVAQRLFLFASQPVAIFNAPLWAAYADAHARGDQGFVRRTLGRSLPSSIAIGGALGMVLLVAGPRIVPYWTRDTIHIPWPLLLAFAIWTPFECGGIALGTYMNGVGLIREQVAVAVCFCLIALPAKIVCAAEFGSTGMVLATTIVFAVVVIGGYATVYRRRIFAPFIRSDR
jgi:O-antigen/teichoic acid export membrane protein